jgi:hypothetical protein
MTIGKFVELSVPPLFSSIKNNTYLLRLLQGLNVPSTVAGIPPDSLGTLLWLLSHHPPGYNGWSGCFGMLDIIVIFIFF